MISIEMITKDDKNIHESINAILHQEFADYEIIIVDSSRENHNKSYENINHIKYIHDPNSNFLNARFNGNKVANGEYVLLLDSTRVIDKNVLKECVNLGKASDMIIIPETNTSKSYILNENCKLKIDDKYILLNCDPINGFFLPRFYKKKILDEAFNKVLHNIQKNKTDNICSLEDRMLYLEASKISNKIGVCENYLIHRESDSLVRYFKKYYRYGKCNYYVYSKVASYSHLGNPKIKKENKKSLVHNSSLKHKILIFIRFIAFLCGFFIGKLRCQKNSL